MWAVSRAVSAASVLVLATVAAPAPAAAQSEYVGKFERTLKVNGPVDLSLNSGSGSITVQPGGGDAVRVVGTVRGNRWKMFGSGDIVARVKRIEANPPIEQTGNRILIGQNLESGLFENISISYELVVPASTALKTHTGSGSILVGSLNGPLKASSGSGSLDIGAIGGPVEVSTGSGQIKVGGAKERVDAHSGSGSIYLRNIAGAASANAGSGSIEVDQTAAGAVRATNGSGGIKISGARGGVVARSGSGSIRVQGAPGEPWDLDAGSGSIHLSLPTEAAFTLDARTGSGSIDIEHPVTVQGRVDKRRLQGTVRGGGPTISAHSSSGSIGISAGGPR